MKDKIYEQLMFIRKTFYPAVRNLYSLIRWMCMSLFIGLIVGLVGTGFYHSMAYVTGIRNNTSWITYLLPVAGLAIVFLYNVTGQYKNKGTNLILSAVQSEEHISAAVAPLMFVSTLITHLFGGSAGREGAALQIGGSLGELLSEFMDIDEHDKKILIMSAMSACFSAVFGTPMAAAIFSMEVTSVGMMYYSAFVPCVTASLTAHMIALYFKAMPEAYEIGLIPTLSANTSGRIIVAAIAFAAISVIFCISLHMAEHTYKKYFSNPYVRIFAGGCIVVLLTLILGTKDYIGAGMPIIEECFEGSVPAYAFILKIIFTAATLGCGFKGGEIVPSFFTGATLGCVIGPLLGLPAPLCAACGLIGVFCGVTNSPITSLIIGFELFGFEAMPYFLITVSVCYMLSGYYGLYSTQKFVYSKYKSKVINRKTH